MIRSLKLHSLMPSILREATEEKIGKGVVIREKQNKSIDYIMKFVNREGSAHGQLRSKKGYMHSLDNIISLPE